MFPKLSEQGQRSLATLHLADGKKLVAGVRLPLSGKLVEALNNSDRFLDLITGDGTQMFLSKDAVLRVEALDPPQPKLNQQRRSSDRASFNPYAVLGVEKSATPDAVRAAYIELVKAYHPDRFAALDLPQEMKDYAAAMQARINMAYQQLGG